MLSTLGHRNNRSEHWWVATGWNMPDDLISAPADDRDALMFYDVSMRCLSQQNYKIQRWSRQRSIAVSREFDTRWVFAAVHSSDEGGTTLIGQVIDGLNELIRSEEFNFIDRVLRIVPTGTASRHVLLTLVRATYPIRPKLNYWQPFALALRHAFEARGLNGDKLLRGLID